MAILERAAKLVGLAGSSVSLKDFVDSDTVSDWAVSAAKFNVGTGLIKGDADGLRPADNITRAESAVIILRLLQKAELVDVRSAA